MIRSATAAKFVRLLPPLLLLGRPGVVQSGPGELIEACDPAGLKAVRKMAREKRDEKDFAAGAAMLKDYHQRCWAELMVAADSGMSKPSLESHLWFLADLAWFYLKSEQPEACLSLIARQLSPYPNEHALNLSLDDVEIEGLLPIKALKNLESRCRGPQRAAQKGFLPGAVEWPSASELRVSVPRKALPPRQSQAFMVFRLEAENEEGDQGSCRDLIWRARSGSTRRKTPIALPTASDIIPHECCNINTVSFKRAGSGAIDLLVNAGGRICSGGTAQLELTEIYRVNLSTGRMEVTFSSSQASH